MGGTKVSAVKYALEKPRSFKDGETFDVVYLDDGNARMDVFDANGSRVESLPMKRVIVHASENGDG